MKKSVGQVTQIDSEKGLWHSWGAPNPLEAKGEPYIDIRPDHVRIRTHPDEHIIRLFHDDSRLMQYDDDFVRIGSFVAVDYEEFDRSIPNRMVYAKLKFIYVLPEWVKLEHLII